MLNTCKTCIFCGRKPQIATLTNQNPSPEYSCYVLPPICGVTFVPDGKGNIGTLAGSARPAVELNDIACEKYRVKDVSIG